MPWVQKSLAFHRKAGRSTVLFICGFAMKRARESFTNRALALYDHFAGIPKG